MQAFRRSIREVLQDNSANAMVVSAFALFAMIGGAGLATDTVQWTLWKRQLQRMADSGAISGAYALAGGASANAAATKEFGRYSYITLSGTPTVQTPPTAGPHTGDTGAVRVVLTTSRSLPFSSLFMNNTPTITAEATGAVVDFGDYCVRSLEPGTTTGITMQGSAIVNLGCGMHTNSQGSPAVVAGGSSTITASPVGAVGAIPSSNNYASGTLLQPYSLKQPDPYAGLADPVVPNGCSPKINIGSGNGNGNGNGGNNVVNPGCYRGVDIQGNATFRPGTYIIDGDFKLGAQARVSGDGVTFILTSNNVASSPYSVGTLKINGGAEMDFKAPTSGTYTGILFYQDRRAADAGGNANIINGNSSSVMEGAIYMPAQEVNFNGTTGFNTTCFYLVSRRVTFSGNSAIDNNCTRFPPPDMTGVQVRLVN